MKNQELLQKVQPSLQILSGTHPEHDFEGVQTTSMKYAVAKNQRYLSDSLEDYQEVLQDLLDEHDVQPTEEGGIPNDAPEEFQEDLNDLLQEESGFEPHQVSESDLTNEPEMPMDVIMLVEDWLVKEE